MKGFKLPRKPEADFAEKLVEENQELGSVLAENLQGALPAIALDGHPALSTAYMNDCEPLLCFAQQVNGYGKSGDVFLGISTSGNSRNVLFAATTAHAKGLKVIGLTGAKDSKLKDMSDVCIKAPQTETYMIQELHISGNINQVAKRCNTNQSVTSNDVEQLRREYLQLKSLYQERLVKALRKLV